MPQGTRHTLTGTLRRAPFGYALEPTTAASGGWTSAGTGGAQRYLDRRVIVEGIRSGFAVIDVQRLRGAPGA